jgi:Short-chain alcohol dehydrogenase of unknown specificity
MSEMRRWFITGVSSGFGKLLAQAALARADSVAGTLRNAAQMAAFEDLAPDRAYAILLDVTDRKGILAAVAEGIARMAGIDILVNNAGYGLGGALEELDEDEIDHVMEANLHGAIYVTKAALPALRASARTARNPLAVYDGTPAGNTRDGLSSVGDLMPGDPARAVAAIMAAADARQPPLRLVLGSAALAAIRDKWRCVGKNLAEWEHVTLSTGFPQA